MLNYSPFQDEEFFYGGKRQNRRDVSKRANRDHKFAFDVVFGPQSSNEDVFRETTRDLVDVLFAGMAVSFQTLKFVIDPFSINIASLTNIID